VDQPGADPLVPQENLLLPRRLRAHVEEHEPALVQARNIGAQGDPARGSKEICSKATAR
jgi:hypothetical protein